MKKQTVDDQAMVRYLLGELSEEEQMALEEKYFSDANLFEHLQNTEDELIRRYVGNELSAEERRIFAKRILSRPWNRDKVKLAQALRVYLTEKPPRTTPSMAALFKTWGAWLRPFEPKPVLAWSIATAMIAMIFFSSWLFFETKDLRTQLSQFEMERRAFMQREQELRQQAEAQSGQNQILTERLQSEQNQRAELEKELSQSSLPKQDLFTVSLFSGVSRSAQEANRLIRSQIASATQLVRLQLYVGSLERYESYRVILETAEGDTIWSQYQLQAQRTDKGRAIILLLPANILSYDDYLITVQGVLPSREIEEVSHYYFSVVKE
jgi:hypothetical protein